MVDAAHGASICLVPSMSIRVEISFSTMKIALNWFASWTTKILLSTPDLLYFASWPKNVVWTLVEKH